MQRLRRRAEFLAAARGPKAVTAGFVLQTLARDDAGPVRVGFTVSKKVGNAVERNRVRRRLREIVRQSIAALPSAPAQDPATPPNKGDARLVLQDGHDYVLIGRRAALQTPFKKLIEDFERALQRLRRPAGPRPKQTRGRPQSTSNESH